MRARSAAQATVRAHGRTRLGRPSFPTVSSGPKEHRPVQVLLPRPQLILGTSPRYKERAARYERSSDWRRGAAGSPDPDSFPCAGSPDPDSFKTDPELVPVRGPLDGAGRWFVDRVARRRLGTHGADEQVVQRGPLLCAQRAEQVVLDIAEPGVGEC